MGWLAEYFPGLYSRCPDGDVPVDSPLLAQYAGLRGTTFSIHQARGVFRHPSTVEYRLLPFGPSSLIQRTSVSLVSETVYEHILNI